MGKRTMKKESELQMSKRPLVAPPVVLTIAGSDNSSGAGIQADLKTFSAHGVYGLTAVTCVVAEVPGHVCVMSPVPVPVVEEQIRLSLEYYPVSVVKTGMLHSSECVSAVADVLTEFRERLSLEAVGGPGMPKLVIDPVMIASSGDSLMLDQTLRTLVDRLIPFASLVTPNLDEARELLRFVNADSQSVLTTEGDMREAGLFLSRKFGVPFLIKGGHLGSGRAGEVSEKLGASEVVTDILCYPDGQHESFSAPRVRGADTHGTGCTYSAAIAANLALGGSLVESVRKAKDFVTAAIQNRFVWKSPTFPAAAGECREVTALNHQPDQHR